MRRRIVALVTGTAVVLSAAFACYTAIGGADPPSCGAPPDPPLRYAAAAPVFTEHCGSCHDRTRSENEAAQRVFESSRYPFATERPETLLGDLDEMFRSRRSLDEAEQCAALQWLAGGARDDDGALPPYRAQGQP